MTDYYLYRIHEKKEQEKERRGKAHSKSKESRTRSEDCGTLPCALIKAFGYVSKAENFFLAVNPSYPI